MIGVNPNEGLGLVRVPGRSAPSICAPVTGPGLLHTGPHWATVWDRPAAALGEQATPPAARVWRESSWVRGRGCVWADTELARLGEMPDTPW